MKNTKLILVLLGITLVAGLGGVWWLSQKDSPRNGEQAPLIKNSPYQDQLHALNEATFEREGENVGVIQENWNEMVPLKPHRTLNARGCNTLDGSLKSQCEEEVLFYEVIASGNVNSCYELNIFKDQCLYRLGKLTDFNHCLNIVDDFDREVCLSDNAFFTNNVDVCDQINEDHERTECIDRFNAMVNGGIQLDDSRGSIESCNNIETLEYFNQCILRSEGDCDQLGGNTEKVNQCESLRMFSVIIESKDASNCSIIPTESYRRVCEIFYSNNRVMQDTDGDGLMDDLELWFSFNPFEAEADAKKLSGFRGAEDPFVNINDVPALADFDGDGISDADEKNIHNTNPNIADTDGDGFSDGEEIANGFDPLSASD